MRRPRIGRHRLVHGLRPRTPPSAALALTNELTAPQQAAPAVARQAKPPAQRLPGRAGLPAPIGTWVEQVRAQPRLALVLGAAVLATALAAAVLWGRAPDYKVLYANLPEREGGAVIASLQQMNVPYRLADGSGAIMVPADQASEVRLKLAAQGLPKAGGVGFELLDNQKFGTSQFAEQVNYQRGLEGELARSIETIGAVASARVHLALPRPSLFVREQKKPSASVVVTLHPGRSLDEGQVSAIVHLVSSSVAELEPRGVTVVDQHGNLLTNAQAGPRGMDWSQLRYVENIEQGYVRRIEAILQPLLGAGNVRAQVAADIDFDQVERTDEKYRPNQEPGTSTIRSQQSSESEQEGGATPGGVPGALSNQPPVTPIAPVALRVDPSLGKPPGAAASAAGTTGVAASGRNGRSRSRRDVTTNYEVDRTISHTQQAAGATRRLSVAVVVNHRTVRGPEGKPRNVPLTAAELEQVRNLVKEAMGFNAQRGDSLNVVNSAFTVDTEETPVLPAWKDPQNLALARTAGLFVLGLLALLVAWRAVVRLQRRPDASQELLPVAATDGAGPGSAVTLEAADPALALQAQRRQADLEYAQRAATEDPRLVASMIRHWMKAA